MAKVINKIGLSTGNIERTSDLINDGETGVSTFVETNELGTAAYVNTNTLATSAQGIKADNALQPGDNISSLTNDSGYLTTGLQIGDNITSLVNNAGYLTTGLQTGDNISELVNDSGYLTTALQPGDNISSLINDVGYLKTVDVVGTDLTYTAEPNRGLVNSSTGLNAILPIADYANAGLFSPTDKSKLDGLADPLTIPQIKADSEINDTISKRHSHDNKFLLDFITEAFTTTLKDLYDTAYNWVLSNGTNVLNHLVRVDNPHNVTKSQVGLGNVPNLSFSGTNTGDQDLSSYETIANNDIKLAGKANLSSVIRESFTYSGSQLFTLSNTVINVYSVTVRGVGLSLSLGQYQINSGNILQINDTLEIVNGVADNVEILYNYSIGDATSYTKAESDTNLTNKVDKVVGKSLILDTEIARLLSMTAVFTTALKTAYDTASSWVTTNGANILSHLTRTDNPHSVTKAQVGLSNVDNTSDANKPISTATQTTLDGKINSSEKGITVATLVGGKVPNDQIPALAISETFEVSSEAQMLALSAAEQGDVAVRSDINQTLILKSSPSSTLANWVVLKSPTDLVSSVNGQTGVVNLSTSNISEGSNLYYTEARVNANANVSANTAARHAHSNKAVLDATTASYTTAEQTKLNGIAPGATANSTDAQLRDRSTHTGTQLSSTISDIQSTITNNSSVAANTAKVTNATHTGEVTGSTALTIANNVVTNNKLAIVPTKTFKGRTSAGTGNVEDLTVAQVQSDLGIGNGSTLNNNISGNSTSIGGFQINNIFRNIGTGIVDANNAPSNSFGYTSDASNMPNAINSWLHTVNINASDYMQLAYNYGNTSGMFYRQVNGGVPKSWDRVITASQLGSNAYTSTAYLPLSGGAVNGVLKTGGFRVDGDIILSNGVGLEMFYQSSNKTTYIQNYHRGVTDDYHPIHFSATSYTFDIGNALFTGSVTATNFIGSATLSGTPTAPTAPAGTNTTQIATTAFVLANGGATSGTYTPTGSALTYTESYWVKTGGVLTIYLNGTYTPAGAGGGTSTITLPNGYTVRNRVLDKPVGTGMMTPSTNATNGSMYFRHSSAPEIIGVRFNVFNTQPLIFSGVIAIEVN